MAIVYNHKKATTGEIFYIGIGLAKARAYTHHGRNKYWHRIVNKHGYVVQITHEGVCKEEAVSIERYLIYFYGRRDIKAGPLINLTDGGEGVINVSWEAEIAKRKGLSDYWNRNRKMLTQRAADQMKNKEFKKKFHEGTRNKWKEEDYRKKKTDQAVALANNPAHRQKMTDGIRKKLEMDPSYREVLAARAKKMWDEPGYKDRMSNRAKEQWKDPKFKKMQSEKTKAQWRNPEIRKKLILLHSERLKNPEIRKKINDGIKKGVDSPRAVKLIVLATGAIIGSFDEAENVLCKTRKTIRTWAKKHHIVMYLSEYLKLHSNEQRGVL